MRTSAVRIAIALGCACAPPTTVPSEVANRGADADRPPPRSACPLLTHYYGEYLGGDRAMWTTAAFPQCPPEPFEYPFWVCGADCPRPCRVQDGDLPSQAVRFDARGRWIETVGERSLGCTYDRDRFATCWRRDFDDPRTELSLSWNQDHLQAIDDDRFLHIVFTYGSGAIARVDMHDVSLAPGPANTYTRQIGRVRTRVTLTYDERGRLIREELAQGADLDWVITTTYGYDDAGRLATRRNDFHATRFAYRNDGRLARVVTTDFATRDQSNQPVQMSRRLEYDPSGRLIVDARDTGDSVSTRVYDYDCR